MPFIRNRNGKWEVEVCVGRVRKSSSHKTKREAVAWAALKTLELEAAKPGGRAEFPVRNLFERYGRDVSVTKPGHRWELIRLNAFSQAAFAGMPLSDLTSGHIALWRDKRLSEVSMGTVKREMTLLSHVFSVAVKEWGYLEVNPVSAVRRPSSPPPRDRLISADEIEGILFYSGYSQNSDLSSVSSRIGAAFLFALETGMRCGEICGLRWQDITGAVARLPFTKNGHPRNVPLSKEALRLVGQLRKDDNGDSVFNLKNTVVDALFRKIRNKAGISDLHFHDTRHEAVTRLARKLDVLDLARMIGHRDLKQLMVYYNAKPDEIAERLG